MYLLEDGGHVGPGTAGRFNTTQGIGYTPELNHAEDTVATQHALILAAMEAWDNLEDRILKNLCETMPNRVTAVIDAEGWYTKY
ncbi:Uncharacterized protein HZ326_22103 [Fusarium oxysporum f. sp. albedinis]|nr:Uncharacterized protein HZ326_22103 [Fusarium oxysporum f. sp. albedinis]